MCSVWIFLPSPTSAVISHYHCHHGASVRIKRPSRAAVPPSIHHPCAHRPSASVSLVAVHIVWGPLQPQARTFVWHRLPNQCLHGFSPYGILRGISILAPGRSETPMLPMALDALCDVTEARCDPARIEKERQAVLIEMTMPW